jgi:hypothetical protein
VGGATHYHVADLGEIWGAQMVRIAQIGQHVFYRRGHPLQIAASARTSPAAALGVPAAAPLELRGPLKPDSDPVGVVLASAAP